MVILGLGEAGKVEMIAEIFRFVVSLWRCEACQELRERQKARLAGVGIPGLADGTFSRA